MAATALLTCANLSASTGAAFQFAVGADPRADVGQPGHQRALPAVSSRMLLSGIQAVGRPSGGRTCTGSCGSTSRISSC
jgi:hypothetical protein